MIRLCLWLWLLGFVAAPLLIVLGMGWGTAQPGIPPVRGPIGAANLQVDMIAGESRAHYFKALVVGYLGRPQLQRAGAGLARDREVDHVGGGIDAWRIAGQHKDVVGQHASGADRRLLWL